MSETRPPASVADVASERAILGGILINSGLLDEASAMLTPGDFYREGHRRIFGAMLRVDAAREPIDLVTLRRALDREHELDAVGGPTYLGALVDGVPHTTSLAVWARSVRECSRVRMLRARAARIVAQADEGYATAADLEALFATGSEGEESDDLLDRAEVARSTWKLLDEEVTGRGSGIPSGYPSLDRLLRCGGWRPGQLAYIGARTSRGKSALLLSLAEAAARTGRRVLVFPLEMSAEDINVRRLVSESGVGLRAVSTWKREEREAALGKLQSAAGILERPIDFAAPHVRSMGRIRATCRRAKRRGLDLIVVDYLGLVRHEGARKGASIYESTTLVSQDLKALAMELQTPILAAVQLNRETAGGGRPGLAHFRDSGAVEQDCDLALLIHQADSTDALKSGWVELIVAKQRNGATGTAQLWWNGPCVRFEDREEGCR
jgi:replicative DNA helicase